jgi:hypothetical protein
MTVGLHSPADDVPFVDCVMYFGQEDTLKVSAGSSIRLSGFACLRFVHLSALGTTDSIGRSEKDLICGLYRMQLGLFAWQVQQPEN